MTWVAAVPTKSMLKAVSVTANRATATLNNLLPKNSSVANDKSAIPRHNNFADVKYDHSELAKELRRRGRSGWRFPSVRRTPSLISSPKVKNAP
jgi:hypothetical protein